MDQDLFTGDPGTPPNDENKNYLEELVGEGKKFRSVEDLAKGKAQSDRFIAQLQAEQEALRKELNTRLTMEQALDQLRQGSSANNEESPGGNQPSGSSDNPVSLKPEDVERIIDQRVTQRETERIQQENLRTVKEALQASLGPEFPNKLKEIGDTLGMTADEMTALAKSKPKAFLALIGQQPAQKKESLFTPPSSSVQTAFKPANTERNKSYYDNLKKQNPKEYWTPRIQNQMHNDALRLQERFFE